MTTPITTELLSREWSSRNDPLRLDDFLPLSNRTVWWKCISCGNEWQAKICNRRKTGCPYCSGRRPIRGKTDLQTMRPDIAKMWDYEKNDSFPSDYTAHSGVTVWWKCEHGHSWKKSIFTQVKNSSCGFCSGRIAIPGETDIQTLFPKVVEDLWDFERNSRPPSDFTRGSGIKVFWKCKKGHSWISPVREVINGKRCRVCSNLDVKFGENDLFTTNPELRSEWDYEKNKVDPNNITNRYSRSVFWKCDKGHSWSNMVNARAQYGYGCPYCATSGTKVLQGFNDLQTKFPEVAEDWDSERNHTTPDHIGAHSGKSVWWECKECGHSWKTDVSSRTRGNGCPRCSAAKRTSSGEDELSRFVKDLLPDLTIQTGDRSVIHPSELDIYIPSLSIAFEFNGLYWHSEQAGKDRTYHYDKWRACRGKGIQLITIWEDDWNRKNDLVKRMIAYKLGARQEARVFARKAKIVVETYQRMKDFLDEFHIQGAASGSLYVGLEDSLGKMVAGLVVQKFKKEIVIARYATSCSVVGGFGKMLKYVERTFPDCDISTFADHEVSDGGLYEKTGFVPEYDIPPDYSYVFHGRRCHKFNFRKIRFLQNPELKYDPNMTEKQLAELNKLLTVNDCGKTKYIKRREQ